jgi:hypothetical protein
MTQSISTTSSRFALRAARPNATAVGALEPRHIPRLIAPEINSRLLAGLCPGLSETTLRAFASIAIVRTLGVSTWDECADLLGIERSYARGLVNNAVVKLNLADARDRFWNALECVKSEIERGPLVDYRERERAFRVWALIPLDQWTIIRRAADVSDDRYGARRRNASAWVWERLTGVDWRESPALGGNASENAREVFRRFERDTLPSLRPELMIYEQQLAG